MAIMYDTIFQLKPNYLILEQNETASFDDISLIRLNSNGVHFIDISINHKLEGLNNITCRLYTKRISDQSYIEVSNFIITNENSNNGTYIANIDITSYMSGVILIKLEMTATARTIIDSIVMQMRNIQ